MREASVSAGLNSMMAVPFIARGNVIGTMILESRRVGAYRGEELALAEANEAAQRLLRDNAGGIDLAEKRIPHIHAMVQRIMADPCGVHRFADGI